MTRRWAAYTLVLALAAALLALSGDAYLLRIATLVGIYAIAAIGFQLVFGRLGLLALSQGACCASGAYVLGRTTTGWGWPPLLALAAAVVVPAPCRPTTCSSHRPRHRSSFRHSLPGSC